MELCNQKSGSDVVGPKSIVQKPITQPDQTLLSRGQLKAWLSVNLQRKPSKAVCFPVATLQKSVHSCARGDPAALDAASHSAGQQRPNSAVLSESPVFVQSSLLVVCG